MTCGDAEFTLLDHSPGYGSVARYYAQYVRQVNEENAGSCPADPVIVIQAMGRKIGYIPAAARLADPHRKMPLQIYLTESGVSLEQLGENVINQLKSDGRCIVVVSEGFDVGEYGVARDNFGHVQYSSSQTTVAQTVVNYLNTLKFPVPGKARGQVPGTDQRNSIAYASVVDLDEAYGVGCHAVEIARKEGNGWMATILRDHSQSSYNVRFDKAPWRKSRTPNATSPSIGSPRTGSTSPTTSSPTPARSSATIGSVSRWSTASLGSLGSRRSWLPRS